MEATLAAMPKGPDFPSPSECVGMTVLVRTSDLNTFHRNPRRGDVDAIAASLTVNGQFTPVVVNVGTHTGRPNEVLAGNHTLKAFRQLAEQDPFSTGWRAIKVHVVDVDEDMAQRIVIVDNRSFEMGGGTDDALVLDMLKEIGTTGTGFADADLDALEAALGNSGKDSGNDGDQDGDDGAEGEPAKPNLDGKPDAAIGFTLIFDDEDQQSLWFEWLKALRDEHPELETTGERLLAHLAETESERV